MIREALWCVMLGLSSMPACAQAKDPAATAPEAGSRTYAQNYKDMVLATCIAAAYKNDPDTSIDAGSSVSALRDWTAYDLEKAPAAIQSLVHAYLARDYRNPVVEAEITGVRFDLLKCLDLYHSRELDAQVNDLVINPTHTYRKDRRDR